MSLWCPSEGVHNDAWWSSSSCLFSSLKAHGFFGPFCGPGRNYMLSVILVLRAGSYLQTPLSLDIVRVRRGVLEVSVMRRIHELFMWSSLWPPTKVGDSGGHVLLVSCIPSIPSHANCHSGSRLSPSLSEPALQALKWKERDVMWWKGKGSRMGVCVSFRGCEKESIPVVVDCTNLGTALKLPHQK